MRTEQDLVAALASLEPQAPDPEEIMAAIGSGAAYQRGNWLAGAARRRGTRRAKLIAPIGAAAAVAAIALATVQLAPGSSGAGGPGVGPAAPLGVIIPTPGRPRFVLAFDYDPDRRGGVDNPMYVFSAADGHQA